MALADLPTHSSHNAARGNARLSPQHGHCRTCAFKPGCLPADLEGEALTSFEHMVMRRPPLLKAGQSLVRHGERMHDFYAVRVGSLKAVDNSIDGDCRVMGFHFPGAIIGLAQLEYMPWTQTFVALEDTALCRIPLTALSVRVHSQLIRLISRSLQREYAHHRLLATKSCAGKIATFLLDISADREQRLLAAARFTLPMTNIDIASYLGMRHESFSRAFIALQHRGLVVHQGKHVHLIDMPALRELQDS